MHQAAVAEAGVSPLRYRMSRAINLFLAKRLGIARVPAIRIARLLNVAARPADHLRRRRLAEAASSAITIPADHGFAFVLPHQVPELPAAVAEAAGVFAGSGEAGLKRNDGGTSRKDFLLNASEGAAMSRHSAIMRLAVSRPVLDSVTRYLREVPIVSNISLLVSVPNQSQVGSQLYHLDFADEKQVKFFIYVDAVDQDSGPFTFVPAKLSERIAAQFRYDRGRLDLEDVKRAAGLGGEIAVTGPAGTAVLIDTSRCLHYGSNRNKSVRVALMIQYTSHAVPEQPPVAWPVEDLARRLQLDDVQRLALSL